MEAQLVAPLQLLPWTDLRRPSLYVGDLDPTVAETDLVQVFSQIGPVFSLHLCRDRFSGRSLCYAYVNFFSTSYAAAAINCLNHTRLKGKTMRIMWCERDPRKRKSGHGNLFVKNLAPSITSLCLEKIFSKYGTILSCKVAEDGGRSKGFGFVQFDSIVSSYAAIHALHGTMLEGKKLYVSKFLKKNERDALDEPNFTSLYVRILGKNVPVKFLKTKFSEFGELRYAQIIRDAIGRSKGYGFVHFKSHNDAKAAMEALNGAQFGPWKLLVRKSERKELINYHCEKKSYGSNLYVKNLHCSISDRDLEKRFGSFGKVTSAKIMRYYNGKSKGFGFVNFSTPEEADRACGALNGKIFLGREPLYVAKVERKEERQKKLQAHSATTHQVPPAYSFLPAFPIMNPAFHEAVMYQHYGNSEGEMYPFVAQSYQQEVFTYIPVQQQNVTYTTAVHRHPIKYPNAGMSTRKMTWHRSCEDQKICPDNRSEAASSSSSLYSDIENIPPGHEVKNTGKAVLVKSPGAQAEKAVQVLVETNYRTGGNNNQFSAKSSKSVRCLSY